MQAELKRRRLRVTWARSEVYWTLGRLGPCLTESLVVELGGRVSRATVALTKIAATMRSDLQSHQVELVGRCSMCVG